MHDIQADRCRYADTTQKKTMVFIGGIEGLLVILVAIGGYRLVFKLTTLVDKELNDNEDHLREHVELVQTNNSTQTSEV